MVLSSRSELVRFQLADPSKAEEIRKADVYYRRWLPLTDYFDIKEPGQYTFTVWPKIYKHSSTNTDICNRIDLPPVSVTFKWNGQTNN